MTRIDCSEIRDLLNALEDGELAASERAAVDAHVAGCSECERARAELAILRGRIQVARTLAPPPGLAARLRERLDAADSRQHQSTRRRLAALAASHLAVAIAGATIAGWALTRNSLQETIARDTVAAHVRAMMAQQIVQVASADTHTVRPWFAGRLAFAPAVTDLSASGFTLAGARVDHVLEQAAAALIYERRKHSISLFVQPDALAPGVLPFRTERSGYNVVVWRQGGFRHIAVSDLNAAELQVFADAFRAP